MLRHPLVVGVLVMLTFCPRAFGTEVRVVEVQRMPLTSYVSIDAGPGETNRIRVRTSNGALRVSETGAGLTVGPGCVLVEPEVASCVPPDGRGPMAVLAVLGDGNDFLLGSPESDLIRGGPGDDFVDGGDGYDDVYGDEGNDELRISAGDRIDHLRGGPGFDTLRDDPTKPLGDPHAALFGHATPSLLSCDGGIASQPRMSEIRRCTRVSYWDGSSVPARPTFTKSSARLRFTCPTPKDAGRGRCTGRYSVAGRRHGTRRFTVPAGTTRTITVPLRAGARPTHRYAITLSARGRYLHRQTAYRASWIIQI